MKRWISMLLCAVMAATAMSSVAVAAETGDFSVDAVQSVTLSGDDAYVRTVTSTDAGVISALNGLLGSATDAVSKPGDARELARLQVQTDGETRTYTVYSGEGGYLLGQGSAYRRISYSTFNDLVNQFGSTQVYHYRTLPQIHLTEQEDILVDEISPNSGSYTYRRMSGRFNAVAIPADTETTTLPYKNSLYDMGFAIQPSSATVRVSSAGNGGKELWSGTLQQAESYRLPGEGNYDISVTATYNTEYCRGELSYTYGIRTAGSGEYRFAVEGGDTHLGEVVVLRVNGTTASDPLATFTSDISLNLPPRFHRQADGSQVALFPVSYRNTAGQHWIEIKCGDQSARFTLNAKDKQWQIQNLTVDSGTAQETIESQRANEEYEQVIAPLRSVADDKQYWSGRFILPASDQKVTTQFGMVRYVNGAPTSTRHGAIDLAVPKGTPVKATGAGRVLYAGYLQLTGNTILIEHGYGLKSWYYHMDSVSVKSSDMVQQGQVIGAVGSTGFSTGPHLHFGMSVNNVFINPYTAIQTDLLAN